MPSKLHKHFVLLSITILMLCPFVFSHAFYSSRPLLRISLVVIPILTALGVFIQGRNLRSPNSGERVLFTLCGLNLLWEFASCFWGQTYSPGIREMGATLTLFLMVLSLSFLRRSVSELYFKKSLILGIAAVLSAVFVHTLYDLWVFKKTILEKHNIGFNSYSLYALKTCFYHKNIVSAFVLLCLVCTYTSSLRFSRRQKLWVAPIIFLCLLLLLLFQSRSAQLALLIFIAGAVIIEFFQSGLLNFKRLAAPVILFAVLTMLIAGTGRLRYSSWNSRSSQERLQLWENTVDLIKERPLLGHGVGNWAMVFPKTGLKDFVRIQEKERNFFVQPHNDYLKVFSETGLVGLLLFLSIPFYLLFLCIKRRKEKEAVYFIALATFYLIILVTGRKGELHVYPLLAALLLESFASTSSRGEEHETKTWGLGKILFFLILPLSFYSAYASYLEHRLTYDMPALRQISNQMDRQAYDEYYSNNYHPLASIARMGQPVKVRYALALVRMGNQEEALALYEDAIVDNPFHLPTKFRAARLYMTCHQEERATELLNEILIYNPTYRPAIDILKSIQEQSSLPSKVSKQR